MFAHESPKDITHPSEVNLDSTIGNMQEAQCLNAHRNAHLLLLNLDKHIGPVRIHFSEVVLDAVGPSTIACIPKYDSF